MKPLTSSSLASFMERFVALRRLSGTDYQSQTRLLVYFDDFLVREKYKAYFISREIFEHYLTGLSHLAPRTLCNRVSVVSRLFRFLSQFKPLSTYMGHVDVSSTHNIPARHPGTVCRSGQKVS